MRVAVFEPSPRVSGVVEWAWHIAEGLRRAGHQADVVSLTRSGKAKRTWGGECADSTRSGWGWWTQTPDVTVSPSTAGAVLNTYDLIVLTEPKCSPFDRDAKKSGGLPLYIQALRATRTPWTTMLHGDQYFARLAPYLEELLSLPNFTGVLLTRRAGYVNPRFEGVLAVHEKPELPYALKFDGVPRAWGLAVGMTGRFVPNKGHPTLGALADRVPARVQLWGGTAVGRGPTYSFLLWEDLVKNRGWATLTARMNRPVTQAFPWDVYRDHARVSYGGSYRTAQQALATMSVHVNLTSTAFAWAQEYTTLEAMEWGCVPVYPDLHHHSSEYAAYPLRLFTEPAGCGNQGVRLDLLGEPVAQEIISQIERAWNADSADCKAANAQALREVNDPAAYARWLLDCVA